MGFVSESKNNPNQETCHGQKMNLSETKDRMQKSIQVFQTQLASIVDSNISAGYVETIKILIDNQQIPVGHIAMVSPGKGRIEVVPYNPSHNGSIAKQLQEKGLNAYTFSKQQVVVNVPRACQEETEKVCAQVRKLGEETKVAIRNVRKKAKQGLKGLDREELRDADKELQELTDQFIVQVDKLIDWRIKYLMK
jgi:ribosome recycling factor